MSQRTHSTTTPDHSYARLLQTLGKRLLWIEGLPWYHYNGFLRPAFLPHACPDIEESVAKQALKLSGAMFARWEYPVAEPEHGAWWLTNRRGPYSLLALSGSTRSKVRRGHRRLEIRRVSADDILSQALRTCQAAVQRFGNRGFMPQPGYARRLAETVTTHPENFEVFGVFKGSRMLGFSENHIQANAVLCDKIWLDPEGLPDYSSYALFDHMLDHYLNQRKMACVSDGVRTLYHDTAIHRFLIDKFGFQQEPARLHLVYRPAFAVLVHAIYPLRKVIDKGSTHLSLNVFRIASAILTQESIRREAVIAS